MLNTYKLYRRSNTSNSLQTTDNTVVLLTLCLMVQYCVELRFYHNSYDRIDLLLVLDLVLDSRLFPSR